MNEEIKEILDDLKEHSDNKYINPFELISVECRLLLDYITNLQTIEQQYSAILSENAELENKINNLQEELKLSHQDNLELLEENERLKGENKE